MMIVDCMTCPLRDQRCDDCSVTALRAHGWAEQVTSAEPELSTEPQLFAGLQLDDAENKVVSIFVGAGLVNAAEVARLRARRDTFSRWGTVRHTG